MHPRHSGSEVRHILRRHTHEHHVRLDHHPLLAGITRASYSLDTYGLILIAYYHFYRAIEPAIQALIGKERLGFDYFSRSKLPWLLADLHHFELDPNRHDLSPTHSLGPFELDNAAQLVGVLYTIEGSTLGGQVIYRHLESNLGLTATHGARFFSGYGKDTAKRWQQFESFMETTCPLPEQRDQAGISAKATFAEVEQLLDDYHAKLLARNRRTDES